MQPGKININSFYHFHMQNRIKWKREKEKASIISICNIELSESEKGRKSYLRTMAANGVVLAAAKVDGGVLAAKVVFCGVAETLTIYMAFVFKFGPRVCSPLLKSLLDRPNNICVCIEK